MGTVDADQADEIHKKCNDIWEDLSPKDKPLESDDLTGLEFEVFNEISRHQQTGKVFPGGTISKQKAITHDDFVQFCSKNLKTETKFIITEDLHLSTWFLTLYNLNNFVRRFPFWIGLLSVMLFAYARFKVTLPEKERLAPPLRPRSFTTAFRYWMASFSYMGCFATLYLSILLLGSTPGIHRRLLDSITGEFSTEVATPAWAALVATAVLPAVPYIRDLDAWIRRQLQEFASIPNKARALATEILAVLPTKEPNNINSAHIDNNTASNEIMDAIAAHRKRLDRLWQAKGDLQNINDYNTSQRYNKFFGDTTEIRRSLQKEVFRDYLSAQLSGLSAQYIESKYRNTIPQVARYLVSAMLSVEGTERFVRERCRRIGFKIKPSEFRFSSQRIILATLGIAVAVFVSCLLSLAITYTCCPKQLEQQSASVEQRNASVEELQAGGQGGTADERAEEEGLGGYILYVREGLGKFFVWSVQTIFIYLPPITVAAAAAMYLLDRPDRGPKNSLRKGDVAVAGILTFFATGMLCFFVLLVVGIFLPKAIGQHDQVMTIGQLLPWALPPALVATTFMVLSAYGLSVNRRWKQTVLYAVLLAIVASIGSLFAFHVLYSELSQEHIKNFLPKSPNPEVLVQTLIILSPLSLGASLGFFLAPTRGLKRR